MARDIPGVFDVLFPQLTSGVVAHFNRRAYAAQSCEAIPSALIEASVLQRAMLFELAVVAAERLLGGRDAVDWNACLEIAVTRQSRHFDARLPSGLTDADRIAAGTVANNLVAMVGETQRKIGEPLVSSPIIPGYQWVASGVGDFAVGSWLLEVKCSQKHFSSADYRQVIMYWLLGYASAVESGAVEWTNCVLLNPRLNLIFSSPFDDIIRVIGAGRSKVEILELFTSLVGDDAFRMLASI